MVTGRSTGGLATETLANHGGEAVGDAVGETWSATSTMTRTSGSVPDWRSGARPCRQLGLRGAPALGEPSSASTAW